MKQEPKEMKAVPLPWHPAFFAGLQIELREEAEQLYFEQEHLLGAGPVQMDVLVVKKSPDYPYRRRRRRICLGTDIDAGDLALSQKADSALGRGMGVSNPPGRGGNLLCAGEADCNPADCDFKAGRRGKPVAAESDQRSAPGRGQKAFAGVRRA